MHQIPSEDLIRLSALSGLSGKEVEERYAQFFHLADGKPHKVSPQKKCKKNFNHLNIISPRA